MASTSSLERGQFPICCNLCETNIQIEFKYVDCDLLLCRPWQKKTYLKFKNTKDHEVISIEEIGTYEKEIDFSDLKCDTRQPVVFIVQPVTF